MTDIEQAQALDVLYPNTVEKPLSDLLKEQRGAITTEINARITGLSCVDVNPDLLGIQQIKRLSEQLVALCTVWEGFYR